MLRIEATELHYNYLDLVEHYGQFEFISESLHSLVSSSIYLLCLDYLPNVRTEMPHPTRVIAKGRPAFALRVLPWSDDVSGNRSKQYNPHMNIYVANGNLPHRKLAQEYFVRFSSTSQFASSTEQFEALAEDL